MNLKTTNGEIDLKMTNAELVAEAIHGAIYIDEKLQFQSSGRHAGQKISGHAAEGKKQFTITYNQWEYVFKAMK